MVTYIITYMCITHIQIDIVYKYINTYELISFLIYFLLSPLQFNFTKTHTPTGTSLLEHIQTHICKHIRSTNSETKIDTNWDIVTHAYAVCSLADKSRRIISSRSDSLAKKILPWKQHKIKSFPLWEYHYDMERIELMPCCFRSQRDMCFCFPGAVQVSIDQSQHSKLAPTWALMNTHFSVS